VTDIVCFRRCRVPIDYFVTTGPSAANETRPTSVRTSAMALVLCKRVRIIHFIAITRKFAPTRDGLFTSTMHLTLNSCQFCLFLLQFDGLTLQNTNMLLLKWQVSLRNEGSANIPASGLLVDCSPVLTLFGLHARPPLESAMDPLLYSTTNQSTLAPFTQQTELIVFSLNNSTLSLPK
jgi:hypothetical protein